MLSNIGPMELIVVLAIALLVLGPKRLPDAGRSLGRGIREFKGAVSGDRDDDTPELVATQTQPTAAAPVADHDREPVA